MVGFEIINDFEHKTIYEWREIIQAKLTSLANYEVFEPIVQTPKDVKSIIYK